MNLEKLAAVDPELMLLFARSLAGKEINRIDRIRKHLFLLQ